MNTVNSFGRKLLLTSAIAASLISMAQVAEAGGRFRGVHRNAAGGVTAVNGAAHQGPNGGRFARGRATVTDGQGNGATISGGAFETPSGAKGARAGGTTVNADGTVNHQSGFAASGAKGSVESQGGTTRNADGTYAGGHTTTATGANGSATSNSNWDSTNGYSRSVTCTDTAGNTVACPTR